MTPKDPKKPGALPPGIQAVGAEGSLGVDIQGLSALAGVLYGYAPATEDVISGIDRRVDKLLSDAGWKGDDARSFETAWGEDSHEARNLSALEEAAGGVIDNLATTLANIQVRLNDRLNEFDLKLQEIPPGTNLPERAKLNKLKTELVDDAKKQSEREQKEAAERLIALYAPEKGWSLLGALNKHDSDEKLSEKFRDSTEDVKDDLADEAEDFWNQDAANDWGATGAFFGGAGGLVVGGVIGAITGAGATVPAGGSGAIPGAIGGAEAGATFGGIVGGVVGFVAGGLFG